MSKRNTGLAGADALFQPQVEEEKPATKSKPSTKAKSTKKTTKPDKQEKIVTTVRVFPETMALLQEIKAKELRNGKRLNVGDILDEAVMDYAKKKKVTTSN